MDVEHERGSRGGKDNIRKWSAKRVPYALHRLPPIALMHFAGISSMLMMKSQMRINKGQRSWHTRYKTCREGAMRNVTGQTARNRKRRRKRSANQPKNNYHRATTQNERAVIDVICSHLTRLLTRVCDARRSHPQPPGSVKIFSSLCL